MALHDHDLLPANKGTLPELPPLQSNYVMGSLRDELRKNYKAAVSLRESSALQTDVPLNQMSQVMNTVTAIIKQMVDLDKDMYNHERQALIEKILVETMKEQPEELQDAFFSRYTNSLNFAEKGLLPPLDS